MKNLGFISKKKVASEIAKIYNEHKNTKGTKEEFYMDCGACSALNFLCTKLNIKPMHRNKLGSGTGEYCETNDKCLKEEYNPPLKYDELKEYMWVWDNSGKRWIELYWDETDKKFEYYEIGSEGEYSFSFEENRYYRKQVEE